MKAIVLMILHGFWKIGKNKDNNSSNNEKNTDDVTTIIQVINVII